jgi:LuxR family quorum-sensing system transcriptional regulator CciR
MTKLQDVQSFIDLCQKVTRPADLEAILSDISTEMGFDHFALIHHVDLQCYDDGLSHMENGALIALSNYPDSWIETYISENMVKSDPVLMASQHTNVGFRWDDVPRLITFTDAHQEITRRTRNAGLANGFTVPAHVPGEANGSCNFAIGPSRELPAQNLAMAQLIGSFAFQAAREIVRRVRSLPNEAIRLTQRQLECVALVGRGKSDWEISRILGISEETVKRHLKDARERYDVPKRVQVVLRSIFDGHIPLADLLK